MDLFKYTVPDTFQNGEAINGWDSASWTERYLEPGEFEITAKLSSGLKDFLPIGTLISHTKTLDMMIVENHQIKEDIDLNPDLTISGRSVETILEARVIGQSFPWNTIIDKFKNTNDYRIAPMATWAQAAKLINDHITIGTTIISQDGIPNVVAVHSGLPQILTEERIINRGSLALASLHELLELDDHGIRVIRRHNFPGFPENGSNTKFLIHDGIDRRDSVIFSVRNGDIDSADYLWSIKSYKNAVLVAGKYIEIMIPGTGTGWNKRAMYLDASDLDDYLETPPTGETLNSLRAAMTTRGKVALKSQKRLALSRIDISRTPTYVYREDYDIGDVVSVDVSYGPTTTMRVIEHVEIDDETGSSSHPTLEMTDVVQSDFTGGFG